MKYVSLKIDFWSDPDVLELTPEQKSFYIYLMTNPRINQIGVYEFSKKYAAFETGYNIDTIEKLLVHFESLGKIKRSLICEEIALVNFFKHNATSSPKLISYCKKLIIKVKDQTLLGYVVNLEKVCLNGANRVSIPYQQQEQEQEEEEEEEQQQQKENSVDVVGFNFFDSKNKYLQISENKKPKRILNGWIVLRDEMEIEEIELRKFIAKKVPSLEVLNIVKKARKGDKPSGLALHLLRKFVA